MARSDPATQTGWWFRFKTYVDLGPPPRPLHQRKLRDIFLVSRPPLLSRRGNRSRLDASSILMPGKGHPSAVPTVEYTESSIHQALGRDVFYWFQDIEVVPLDVRRGRLSPELASRRLLAVAHRTRSHGGLNRQTTESLRNRLRLCCPCRLDRLGEELHRNVPLNREGGGELLFLTGPKLGQIRRVLRCVRIVEELVGIPPDTGRHI